MNKLRHLSAAALLLALASATPAFPEALIIEGRAAQALHCATMLVIVGAVVNEIEGLSDRDMAYMALAADTMMDQVPGTEAQKRKAMEQRAEKIVATRTLEQLAEEFRSTADWCMKKFL